MGKSGNKQQAEELRKLVAAINTTNTLLLQNQEQDKEKKKDDKSAKTKAQETRKRKLVTAKGMYAVNKLTSAATAAMKDALNSSLKLQETALGRGMDLQSAMEASKTQTSQFAGSMTGFGTAVQLGYEQFESGLKTTDKGMNELALYTKLTGGNSKKLLKSIAGLTAGMELSQDQSNALGSSIQGLSQNFGMTSEELVDSLKGLDAGMRSYKILGIGADITKAGVTLSAAMGKQAGSMGTELLATLTSAEGMYTAAALGVTSERLALLKGEGDATQTALFMVEKAGKIAKDRIDQMVSGGMDPSLAIKALDDTLGKGAGDAYLVWKQTKKEADRNGRSVSEQFALARSQQKKNQEFTNSWNNFKEKVFSPLTETIMRLTGGLLDWASNNQPLLVKIGQGLVLVATGIASYLSFQATKKLASTASAMLRGGGQAVKNMPYGLGKMVGGGIRKTKGAASSIGKVALDGADNIKSLWEGAKNIVKPMGAALLRFGKYLLPMLWTGLTTALAAIPFFGWVVLALGALIFIFKDQIWEALKGIWEAVKPIAKTVWTAIKDLWSGIKLIGLTIGAVLGAIFKAIGAILSGIWSAITWVWGKLKSFFEYIFSPLTGLLDALRSSWIGRQLFGDVEDKKTETETANTNFTPDRIEDERGRLINDPNSTSNDQLREQLNNSDIDPSRKLDQLEDARALRDATTHTLLENIATNQENTVDVAHTQAELTSRGNYDRKNQTRPTAKRQGAY